MPASTVSRKLHRLLGAASVVFLSAALALRAIRADTATNPEPVRMDAFQVKGDMLEDFGFRVSPDSRAGGLRLSMDICPVVDLVLPNTAASKAGFEKGSVSKRGHVRNPEKARNETRFPSSAHLHKRPRNAYALPVFTTDGTQTFRENSGFRT